MHGQGDLITDILHGVLITVDGVIQIRWLLSNPVTDTARLMESVVRAAPRWEGNMLIEAAELIIGILSILTLTDLTLADE
jgi:hypothetical protein